MHYYKRNIGDYAKKCGRLTMLQHGSYTLLIDSCYDREQFPTLEEAIEWTWASSKEEIEAVEFVLKRFFTLENGVYVQKRIQEEIAEYHNKSTTNKRIAAERETKRKANTTNRERIVDESSPEEHEAPPNHKPLTNNQEPVNTSLSPAKLPTVPTQAVIDLYHETLPELPTCRLLGDGRKKAIATFWKWVLTSKRSDGQPRATNEEEGLAWIHSYFCRARDNDFLMGRLAQVGAHANWVCDLDFLLTDKGKKQVIEKTKEAA